MSTRCQIEFHWPAEKGKEPYDRTLAARIYQHSDGYPSNVLPQLKWLEKLLSQNIKSPMGCNYGSRTTDPEWSAAEFVVQFRSPSNAPTDNPVFNEPIEGQKPYGVHFGNVYVTQELHGDIEYLYRVTCTPKWKIEVFSPVYDNHERVGFARLRNQGKPKDFK